jgi:hypothetical protein
VNGRGSGDPLPSPAVTIRRVLLPAIVCVLVAAGCTDDAPERDADGQLVTSGDLSVFDLVPGDCLLLDESLEPANETLPVVPCEEPHEGEVYALVEIDDIDVYPGERELSDRAELECLAEFSGYVGVDLADSVLFFTYMIPSIRGWQDDADRTVVCIVLSAGGIEVAQPAAITTDIPVIALGVYVEEVPLGLGAAINRGLVRAVRASRDATDGVCAHLPVRRRCSQWLRSSASPRRHPTDDPNDPEGLKPRLVTNWTQFESPLRRLRPGCMLPALGLRLLQQRRQRLAYIVRVPQRRASGSRASWRCRPLTARSARRRDHLDRARRAPWSSCPGPSPSDDDAARAFNLTVVEAGEPSRPTRASPSPRATTSSRR